MPETASGKTPSGGRCCRITTAGALYERCERTSKRWPELSQGHAFFAYPWKECPNKIRTPKGVRGILDTPSACANSMSGHRGQVLDSERHTAAAASSEIPSPDYRGLLKAVPVALIPIVFWFLPLNLEPKAQHAI